MQSSRNRTVTISPDFVCMQTPVTGLILAPQAGHALFGQRTGGKPLIGHLFRKLGHAA